MIRFAKKQRCVRCGSRRQVKVVTYVRPQQKDRKLSEPWCQRCRRAKLVMRRS